MRFIALGVAFLMAAFAAAFARTSAAADMALADAFAARNPSARVVKIADADHYVFESHADDVQREMDTFMNGLR